MNLTEKEKSRFWAKVQKTNTCWLWTGCRDHSGKGYGNLGIAGRPTGAHRISYEMHKGEIPPGLYVCHDCDNKICVNPDHLHLGTHAQNLQEAAARGLMGQQLKTACKRGHEFTPKNTYTWKGVRLCRVCRAAKAKRYRAKVKNRILTAFNPENV